MKKTRRILLIVFVLALYFGSLVVKNNMNSKKAGYEPPTISKIKNEKGIPVYAQKVKSGDFHEYTPLSGFMQKNGVLKSYITPQVHGLLKMGMPAVFQYEGKRLNGKITNLSARSSVLSGLYEAEMTFQNIPVTSVGKLVVATVPYKTIKNVIVLGRDSVSFREKTPFIFEVKEDRSLVKRQVHISAENDDSLVIDQGVQPGDTIITSDPRYLNEKDIVFIANEMEK